MGCHGVAAFLMIGRAQRSLLQPRGKDWCIFYAMVPRESQQMNSGAQWVQSEVWATGPKVDLGQGLLLTWVLHLPTYMDDHASKYRSHRFSNRSMLPRHRSFHWPTMSGIMSPMAALAGSHITFPIPSTSLYQRLGDKPAIQPWWVVTCGRRWLVAVSSSGGLAP